MGYINNGFESLALCSFLPTPTKKKKKMAVKTPSAPLLGVGEPVSWVSFLILAQTEAITAYLGISGKTIVHLRAKCTHAVKKGMNAKSIYRKK